MSNKLSKKEKKTMWNNKSAIIAIAIGCLAIGVMIGLLSGKLKNMWNSRSGKMSTGGELVDYQSNNKMKLGQYKGLSMSLEVTEEDIENEIEFLLEDNVEVERLEGPAKDGDIVNINFVGRVDGKEFEDGTAEDYDYEIGSEEFVDGFEEQLIGMKAGEVKDVAVTFPSDYGDEELDGKDAVFTVTLNYVSGEELETEFNDAFVSRISDGEYQTVDAYKEYMRQYLYEENVLYKADTYWDMVMENIDFRDVDEGEFNKAYQETVDMYENFSEVYDSFLEEYGSDEEIEATALDMAYERMAAKTIAKLENIEMTDEYYRNAMLKELEEEEYQNMTAKELEDEYLDVYASDPKDDMLVILIKERLAETAVIE